MFEYISGKLVVKRATDAVVDVGGLGYHLKISLSTSQRLPGEGEMVVLKSYLHVREDVMQLYGFADDNEREIFLGLLSISGVGPKLAQTILSGFSPEKLVFSIRQGDEKSLSSISGIGKKTAQRLIVELKDKFGKMILNEDSGTEKAEAASLNDVEREAVLALVSLGYPKPSAEKAIGRAQKAGKILTVEEMIKKALQTI
ncbi:MAG: Holliday junction branch migration protein RuvA [Calditrichaceae bacterium]